MSKCIKILIFTAIISMVACLFASIQKSIQHDYVREVVVDKSEKVERALEIATEDVKQRGFIIFRIDTSGRIGGKFVIRCYGIEKGNLLNLD